MTDRWRQPVRLVGIESSTDTMKIGDRVYRDYEYLITRDDWERIRTGYVCIQCFEPHEQAFPKQCSVCGLARSEHQARIGHEYAGTIVLPDDLDDEIENIAEQNERRMYRPQSSIVLPRGVTLD